MSSFPTTLKPTSNTRSLLLAASDSSQKAESYRKKGDVCKELSEDETGAVLLFASLEECCANMFWFDMDGCISRSHFEPKPSLPRFYPTWIRGQLCSTKESFDDWEESYLSLSECCESHFSWDFIACCSSTNMGGC
jgi:hypothetical protein